MKLNIVNTKNEQTGTIELPTQFDEEIRRDLIRRAVLTIEANMRQRYGTDPRAGLDFSAKLSKRRKKYRGSYGLGIARTPRKIMSRSGTRFGWVGAVVPYTRGGRVAHPPKSEKIWDKKMNVKERRKAIRSAMAASVDAKLVAKRGHVVPKGFPFIIDSDFETVNKTKVFAQALDALGMRDELARSAQTKTLGGAAALRGRRIKRKTGPLIVVSKMCPAQKAARNIPGVDVVTVRGLNAKVLAPGCHVGRITLYTKDAIEAIKKETLYM
jgi:large subunit ribosomal protein L4e